MFTGFIHKIFKSFRGPLEALVEAEGGHFEKNVLVNYVYSLVFYPKNELNNIL